jgi:hypothetical protein
LLLIFFSPPDVEAPQFPNGCPGNVEAYSDRLGQLTALRWNPPVVTDNSGISPTLVSDVASGSNFSVGVANVTYFATDAAGNTQNCSLKAVVLREFEFEFLV